MDGAEPAPTAGATAAIRPVVANDMPALRAVIDGVDLFPSDLLLDIATGYLAGGADEYWLTVDLGGPVALA